MHCILFPVATVLAQSNTVCSLYPGQPPLVNSNTLKKSQRSVYDTGHYKTPPAHRTLLSAKINSTKAALWIMKISTQKNLQAAVKWQLLKSTGPHCKLLEELVKGLKPC